MNLQRAKSPAMEPAGDDTVTDESSHSDDPDEAAAAPIAVPNRAVGKANAGHSSTRRLSLPAQRALRSTSGSVQRNSNASQSTQDGAAETLERALEIKRVLEKQRQLLEAQVQKEDLAELSEESQADAEVANVVDELIRTEATYLADLEFTMTEFCRPLQELVEGQVHYRIFSNLEQLFELHLKLSRELSSTQQLQAAEKQEAVLAAFTLMLPYFRMYSQYCANYPNSSNALQEAYDVPTAGDILEEREATHTTTLQALLFRPVQRICLYPLLFQNMVKYTRADAPYHPACEKMLEGAIQLTAQLNENVRQHEARHYMSEVLTREVQLQTSSLEYLFQASMTLEHEAVVDMKCRSGSVLSKSSWRIRRPYKWYVFCDCILVCRPSRTGESYQEVALWSLNAITTSVANQPPPMPSTVSGQSSVSSEISSSRALSFPEGSHGKSSRQWLSVLTALGRSTTHRASTDGRTRSISMPVGGSYRRSAIEEGDQGGRAPSESFASGGAAPEWVTTEASDPASETAAGTAAEETPAAVRPEQGPSKRDKPEVFRLSVRHGKGEPTEYKCWGQSESDMLALVACLTKLRTSHEERTAELACRRQGRLLAADV